MTVVGAGRVGLALRARAEARGAAVGLVDRAPSPLLEGEPGRPILLAVRNDDLREVVGRVAPARRADLVALQNGALRELLAELGIPEATRGLLYFLVRARGAPVEPGSTSWLAGPHAEAVARWFGTLDLDARAISREAFTEVEFEKLLWLACLGPLCEAHEATVGEIVREHRTDLAELVEELAAVGAAAWGVTTPPQALLKGLVAYSETIPEYRASVKEWPYRNGWFRSQAQRLGWSLPRHDHWLARR